MKRYDEALADLSRAILPLSGNPSLGHRFTSWA